MKILYARKPLKDVLWDFLKYLSFSFSPEIIYLIKYPAEILSCASNCKPPIAPFHCLLWGWVISLNRIIKTSPAFLQPTNWLVSCNCAQIASGWSNRNVFLADSCVLPRQSFHTGGRKAHQAIIFSVNESPPCGKMRFVVRLLSHRVAEWGQRKVKGAYICGSDNMFENKHALALMNNQRKQSRRKPTIFSKAKNTRLSLKDKGCNCEGPHFQWRQSKTTVCLTYFAAGQCFFFSNAITRTRKISFCWKEIKLTHLQP